MPDGFLKPGQPEETAAALRCANNAISARRPKRVSADVFILSEGDYRVALVSAWWQGESYGEFRGGLVARGEAMRESEMRRRFQSSTLNLTQQLQATQFHLQQAKARIRYLEEKLAAHT